MKAIVLAGGYGKRVMPMSYYKPKPMLPVANRPVIDYVVGRLAAAGINEVAFALAYKPTEIMDYVSGYIDLKPHFVCEQIPMGTAGSVKRALSADGDDFIVLSADTVCNSDLKKLISAHNRSGAIVTMETVEVQNLAAFGAVTERDGFVTEIKEKNPFYQDKAGLANSGTYIINRRAFEYVPDDRPFDFARDLFPLLLSRGEKIAASAVDGYWKDVGSLADYYDANFDVMKGSFPIARHLRRVRSRYRGGSLIAETALVSGRVKDCVIGDGAIIASSARLERCIVLPGEAVRGESFGNVIGADFTVNPMLGNVNLNNVQNSANIFRLFASIRL